MKFFNRLFLTFALLTAFSFAKLQAQNCGNFLMSVLEAFEAEFQDDIAEAISDLEILQEEAPEKPNMKKLNKGDIANKDIKKADVNPRASKELEKVSEYRAWKARQANAKNRMNDKIDEWQVWWKDEFGSNWASVGPRALNIDDSGQNGNLAAGAGTVRIFYTEPNMLYEDVKIKIEKTGGQQKGWMIVCRYHIETPDHAEFVGEVEFAKGKENIGDVQEIVCEDCAGYHLSVKVRKNAGIHNFGYRVSSEGINPVASE